MSVVVLDTDVASPVGAVEAQIFPVRGSSQARATTRGQQRTPAACCDHCLPQLKASQAGLRATM